MVRLYSLLYLPRTEGHLERTIEDLMKLNEEIENSPDDDNLFADTDSRPSYPNSYGGGYQSNAGAKSVQESEGEISLFA